MQVAPSCSIVHLLVMSPVAAPSLTPEFYHSFYSSLRCVCVYVCVIQEQMTLDTPLDPVAPSVFIFVLYGMLTLYHQDDHFICESIHF